MARVAINRGAAHTSTIVPAHAQRRSKRVSQGRLGKFQADANVERWKRGIAGAYCQRLQPGGFHVRPSRILASNPPAKARAATRPGVQEPCMAWEQGLTFCLDSSHFNSTLSGPQYTAAPVRIAVFTYPRCCDDVRIFPLATYLLLTYLSSVERALSPAEFHSEEKSQTSASPATRERNARGNPSERIAQNYVSELRGTRLQATL
jgi:hypothetical protein